VRTRTCSSCAADLPLTEEFFYRSSLTKSGFQARCKVCDRARSTAIGTAARAQTPVVRGRYERPARRQRICPACASLPHRRPPEGCWRCDQPYAPEPPTTIDDALKAPSKFSREVVF
jgi:hypothetical protein